MRYVVIFCMLFLSGCGLFKKHKEVETTSTNTKVDSSATKLTKVHEKVDTLIPIKGVKQNGSKPFQNILHGDSIVLDNEKQHVIVDYDPTTGNIRAKAQVKDIMVPLVVDKSTTIAEESNKTTEVKSDHEHKVKDTSSDTTGMYVTIGLFLFMFLMLIIMMIIIYVRRMT